MSASINVSEDLSKLQGLLQQGKILNDQFAESKKQLESLFRALIPEEIKEFSSQGINVNVGKGNDYVTTEFSLFNGDVRIVMNCILFPNHTSVKDRPGNKDFYLSTASFHGYYKLHPSTEARTFSCSDSNLAKVLYITLEDFKKFQPRAS